MYIVFSMRKLAAFLWTLVLVVGVANASGKPPERMEQIIVQQQQATAQQQQHPENDKRGRIGSPLEVHIDKTQDEATEDQNDRGEHASTDWWTIRIGVFTFVILCVQTGVFGWQGKQLKRTVEEMESATKATKLVADTLAEGQRPWVKINTVKQAGSLEDGADDKDGGYNIEFGIKNIGHSPATCIYTYAEIVKDTKRRFPDNETIKRAVERGKNANPSPGITLVADDSVTVGAYCLPDEEIDVVDESEFGVMVCCVSTLFRSKPLKGTDITSARIGSQRNRSGIENLKSLLIAAMHMQSRTRTENGVRATYPIKKSL